MTHPVQTSGDAETSIATHACNQVQHDTVGIASPSSPSKPLSGDLTPLPFRNQGHEAKGMGLCALIGSRSHARDDRHHLATRIADGDDEPPTGPVVFRTAELFKQRIGHVGGCRRDDDPVEGGHIGPALGYHRQGA